MNVQEAMQAVKDGTFESKLKRQSADRLEAAETKATGAVQRGRELYASLHTKKED